MCSTENLLKGFTFKVTAEFEKNLCGLLNKAQLRTQNRMSCWCECTLMMAPSDVNLALCSSPYPSRKIGCFMIIKTFSCQLRGNMIYSVQVLPPTRCLSLMLSILLETFNALPRLIARLELDGGHVVESCEDWRCIVEDQVGPFPRPDRDGLVLQVVDRPEEVVTDEGYVDLQTQSLDLINDGHGRVDGWLNWKVVTYFRGLIHLLE